MSEAPRYEPSELVRQRGSNMYVDRVTAEVCSALAERDIRAILLKGPAVAGWLYAVHEVRPYSDTDILVSPSDVAPAEEALTTLGFELPPIYDELERPSPEHAWVRRRDGVRVDLHWNLTGPRVDDEVAWQVLARDTEAIEVAGTAIEALGLPARALHVALHAAQHGSELGKALEDLSRAAKSLDEDIWKAARELALELDAVESFALGLRLDERGEVIAERLALPAKASVEARLRSQAAPASAVSLDWFLSRKGLGTKLRLVARNLFPSPSFLREWSPLARRGWWGLTLAYLYRPLYLLRQLVVGGRALVRAQRETSTTKRTDQPS